MVGIRAREHNNLQRHVSLGSLNQRDKIANQFGSEKTHRRGCDVHEENGRVLPHVKRLTSRLSAADVPPGLALTLALRPTARYDVRRAAI